MMKKRVMRPKMGNTYTVVSIRGPEEFFKGTFTAYKDATKLARSLDRRLTVLERAKGDRTEVWTNYNEINGTVQTVHRISQRRH